ITTSGRTASPKKRVPSMPSVVPVRLMRRHARNRIRRFSSASPIPSPCVHWSVVPIHPAGRGTASCATATDAADTTPKTPARNVALTATSPSLLLFASRVTLQLFHVPGLGVAVLHVLQDELAAVIEGLGLEGILLR